MIERILLVQHVRRRHMSEHARAARAELERRGITVLEEDDLTTSGRHGIASGPAVDLVLALGGDGTILAAADHARHHGVPLVGVNLGHLGFLAEVSGEGIPCIIDRLVAGDFTVEERMTLDVTVHRPDGGISHDWAFNEAAVLRTDVARPGHFALVVDGQDVSTYGADGIVVATPTGSTAYSFSAGGPVVWPDLQAIVMAPLAAHGLFTRPMVLAPSSVLEVIVMEPHRTAPELWCDGLRHLTTEAGTTIRVRAGERPVRLARLDDTPFSTRLVTRFELPVRGWRSHSRSDAEAGSRE